MDEGLKPGFKGGFQMFFKGNSEQNTYKPFTQYRHHDTG